MNIGILTFEQHEGKPNNSTGSSRIRARWLIKYWSEAEEFVIGKPYDVVIYQKAYFVEHAKLFKGFKILDLCDPDWLHWGYRIKEMIEEVDVITTSTVVLADAVKRFAGNKPVLFVPDRVDLDFYVQKKVHSGVAKTAVWSGYSTAFTLVTSTLEILKRNNLNLIVISDTGFSVPMTYQHSIEVINYPWTVKTVNDDILRGDIVLNPQSENGRWKYKSNNKTVAAWALGMPVAHNTSELEHLLVEGARIEEAQKRMKEVREKYDVKLSVEEYKNIIQKYVKK